MSLEHQGMVFLRKQKNCPVAMFERTPRPLAGWPDVIGVTNARYLLEIEIKRSISDFYANNQKRHILRRNELETDFKPGDEKHLARYPKLYWFLVPEELVPRIAKHIPKWAGLLSPAGHWPLKEIVEAPVNKYASKLTIKETLQLGNLMANQIWTMSTMLDAIGSEEYMHDEHLKGMSVFI